MGETGFEFPSFPASKLPSFRVSKFPMEWGGGEEGRTIERLRTDHVISGPMRGLKKLHPLAQTSRRGDDSVKIHVKSNSKKIVEQITKNCDTIIKEKCENIIF